MWMTERKDSKGKTVYRFRERYTDPYTEKQKIVSVTLTSKSSQAKKQAQMQLQDIINKRLAVKDTDGITFGQLMTDWWAFHETSIRNSSKRIYGNVLRVINDELDQDALLKNLDTKYYQDFINTLGRYAYSYRKKFKVVLNMAYNYAMDMGIVEANPITRVKVPKPAVTKETYAKIETKYLEQEEMDRLLKQYYSTYQSVAMGRLAEFMYLTGLRVGEAISLTVNNYDREARTICVEGTLDYNNGYQNATKEMPKTMSSYRTIGLSNRAVEIMDELVLENQLKSKNNFLFVGKTGKPIQVNSFNNSLKYTNEKLGENKINKQISSHIFRHSHISLLTELGVPIKAIMDRVGHSDPKTTMTIYTHVTKKTKSNVVDLLNKAGK